MKYVRPPRSIFLTNFYFISSFLLLGEKTQVVFWSQTPLLTLFFRINQIYTTQGLAVIKKTMSFIVIYCCHICGFSPAPQELLTMSPFLSRFEMKHIFSSFFSEYNSESVFYLIHRAQLRLMKL